jgi:hypothetical protein
MRFTLAEFLALTMAASATPLPQDLKRQEEGADFDFYLCDNNHLSCCSDIDGSASSGGGNGALSGLLGTVLSGVPFSLLSGCAAL